MNPVPATSVSIGNPTGVAVDNNGNLYIAGPSIVFKVDPSGMLTRIAGNGHNGFSGDGGPATDALLGFPRASANDPIDFWDVVGSLAIDSSGNVYIADFFNNRIRRITSDGTISTVAGDSFMNPFGWPGGVAVGGGGELYVVASFDTVWRVTPESKTRLVLNNCGRPGALGLCVPYGVSADGNGNVYVADTGNCRVLGMDIDGNAAIVAGDPRPSISFLLTCGYSGDGGLAVPAALNGPYGVSIDQDGNLYIADTYNHRIRKVSANGITTVAGVGSMNGFGGYSGDNGPAVQAQLNLPHAVAVDLSGNLFIADTENFRIRKVTPDGVITTVAGNGVWCCGDQRSANSSSHSRVR
jgi:sugar lactone lactonase YvrE